MNAIVTAQFYLPNVCNPEDLGEMTFEEMVRWLIREEGLFGMVDGETEIVAVEEAP